MKTKTFKSPTYGEYTWRLVGIMSVLTFNAEEPAELRAWTEAHPTKNFQTLSIAPVEEGVFEVWLPLARDNLEWVYTGRTPELQKLKKGELPIAVTDKQLVKWFEKAERFMTAVSDVFDAVYDNLEKTNEPTNTPEVPKNPTPPVQPRRHKR